MRDLWTPVAVSICALTISAVALVGCGDDDTCMSPALVCNGTCVDPRYDPSNCGACGAACAAGEICSDGTCEVACGGGTSSCGGTCVDTNRDPMNCGGCGMACTGAESCDRGTCTLVCSGGTTSCSGSCVDTDHDPENCGGCGTPCDADEVCSSGSCGPFCTGGTIDCDGACVDPDTDEEHCGGCTTMCEFDQTCEIGSCEDICDASEEYCSGRCTDTQTDVRNCGMCGEICGIGSTCTAGACATAPEVTVLVFYDDENFMGDQEPAILAATALGYTVQAVYADGPAFAAAYAGRSWDLVVIDSSYNLLPAEVFPVITARTAADLPLVVAYYDLDGSPATAAELEVTPTNYTDPEPISSAAGASPNLFTYSTTITGPLIHAYSYGDDGDYLAPTAGGDVLLVGSEDTEALAVVTNARSSLVLGFLVSNYRDTDVDGDSTPDMVELFTNILRWYADGNP